MNKDLVCICGHLDSWHCCSEKAHKKPNHICNVTSRIFCDGKDEKEGWSCPCLHYKQDNLKYLEDLYDKKK